MNRRRFLGVAATGGGAALGAAALTGLPGLAGAVANGTAGAATNGGYAATPPNEISYVAIPAGQVARAVSRLDGIASRLRERSGVPGMAVAVVHRGKVVFARGYGVRKVGTGKKVTPDTVFQLASVSKAVSSTVVARAVGQKTVAWDDPIVAHLPDFALSDPYVTQHVTYADLFSHRSGLPDHAGDLLEDLGFDQADIVQRLRYYPLDPFRSSYAYTNFGLTAAALAVAAARGTSWPDLCQQLLYDPLQMTSTSDRYSDYRSAANHAALHVQVGGKWKAKYTRDPDAQAPAGGVSSSVRDMTKWLRLQLAMGRYGGQQLVASAPLLDTHIPHVTSAPAATATARSGFYGLGNNVGYDGAGRVQIAHSGAFASGASTAFLMLPSEELGIIALTNGWPIGLPEAVNASFTDEVLVGRVTRDWLTEYRVHAFAPMLKDPSALAGKKPPKHPAPAAPDAAYVGTYTSPLYGPAQVASGPGGLTLSLGPKPEVFPLSHWDGDEFSYHPTGENAIGYGTWISAVTFAMGPGGQATSVDVEHLDGNEPLTSTLGTFTRA